MKGVIFNLLEAFVVENLGEEAYENLIEQSKKDMQDKGPFVGPGNYHDKDFMLLVKNAVEATGQSIEQITCAFGKFCFPHLADKIKPLLPQFKDLRSMLMGIDSVIHVEVNKLMKGVNTPKFSYTELEDGSLILKYESERKLYDFAEGIMQGAADHYQEKISITRSYEGEGTNEVCNYKIQFST